MRAIGYAGIQFDAINVKGGIEPFASGPARRAVAVNRMSSTPLHAGVSQDTRTFVATFQPKPGNNGESTLITLLGALDLDDPDERTFVAQLNDNTTVTCEMSIGTYRWTNTMQLQVEFSATNPKWRKQSETTFQATATGAAPEGVTVIPMVNRGGVRVSPEIVVTPTVQRVGDSATCGWKYYRTAPIENGSGSDWIDEPITILLGDTADWVTNSKAQADGDDIRVRYQGQEFNRTLTCMNTKFTLCHILVSLKASKSKTLEVWYGNPSATAPNVTLSTRTGTKKSYAAPDLEGDSGTATNASTTTEITVSGKSWETDRWKGGYVGVVSGQGSVRWRRVDNNDGDTLFLNRALNTAPNNTSSIVVFKSGIFMDGGRVTGGVSSTGIQDNAHTRKWGSKQLVSATVTFHGGTANPATMVVDDNGTDTLTFTTAFSVNPTVGDSYTIQRYGVWSYVVDTALQNTLHRGIARQNAYYEPPGKIWPGKLTPGGWGPDTYLDNDDDFATYRSYDVGSGGGHAQNWWYLTRMRRRVAQTAELPYEDEGDGFSINVPQAFQGIYFDYQMQNEGAVGKVVFAGREPGSEEWRDIVTNVDKHAALTPIAAQYVDLTAYNYPTRLGFFVLPFDGVEIPVTQTEDGTVTARTASTVTDSSKSMATDQFKSGVIEFENASTAVPKAIGILSNTGSVVTTNGSFTTQPTVGDAFTITLETRISSDVEFRNGDALELFLYHGNHPALEDSVYEVGAEVEIYDLQAELRLGGGTDEELPHELISIGGPGHWIGLPIGYGLRVAMDPDATTPLVSIMNSGTLVSRAQWAVLVDRIVADSDGNPFHQVPRGLFPLKPAINLLTNPSFAVDLAGWATGTTTGGVTVSVTQDSSTFHGSELGSMEFAISAAPVGAWTTTQEQEVSSIPIGSMVETGWWVYTTDVDLKAYLKLEVSANGETGFTEYTFTLPTTGQFYSIGAGLLMPIGDGLGDTGTATVTIGVASTGANTGDVYFDDGSLGPPNMYVTESDMGELVITPTWLEGWHS